MSEGKQDQLPPIEPLHERWEPAADPLSIDVPGLDRSAPVQDQIEFLEQMITIKLQNIDANFARAHQILSTRILPAVKRFSVNTEPVREAAKFWVSFYEQAAQVRIPTADDFTEEFEEQTATQEEEEEEEEVEPTSHGAEQSVYEEQRSAQNVTITASESSFASGANLISSTPMSHSQKRLAASSSRSQQPDNSIGSWAHSLESPLDRLDRDLRSLTEEDETLSTIAGSSSRVLDTSGMDVSSKGKGKGKQAPSLLQNVLSKNIRGSAPSSPAKSRTMPLHIKKTPKRNPYVPPNTKPADWDGIVDLSNTPKRTQKHSGQAVDDDYSDEDSEISLPPGMSPPTTMDFARPPRSATRLNLTRTPAKQAAMRIGNDLIGNVERLTFRGASGSALGGTVESSMSTISSPSLSRHTRQALGMDSQTSSDPSLDSVMRRVGLNNVPITAEDSFDDSFDQTPNPAFFGNGRLLPEDGLGAGDDSDSSDSSFEEGANGAPSAAFLMASQRRGRDMDDSFGSSNQSSDSISDEEAEEGVRAIHPFAAPFTGTDDGLDDSFDDDDDVPEGGTATIFGTRAVQQQQPGSGAGVEFRLKQLVDDTRRNIPRAEVPNTPTPFTLNQPQESIKPFN